jgi:Raf kinase inhibitor-like YbhB/YbcL family protein
MAFVVESPAFPDGQAIPRNHTCDGDNLSPPLEWSGAPDGTRSFALIVEDPDAPRGTFRHWGLYNIAGTHTRLPEGFGRSGATEGAAQAVNDFGHARYDGPCPPKGHGRHRYQFHLLALDVATLGQAPNRPVADLWRAVEGHVLARAELVGTYQR